MKNNTFDLNYLQHMFEVRIEFPTGIVQHETQFPKQVYRWNNQFWDKSEYSKPSLYLAESWRTSVQILFVHSRMKIQKRSLVRQRSEFTSSSVDDENSGIEASAADE